MKNLLIVANWKSNKTVGEMEDWIKQFLTFDFYFSTNLKIILCPPFTLLYPLKLLIDQYKLPITLGAQDISPFPSGAYTGEISAKMLKDLGVDYVLIGHSERRKYFAEQDNQLENKVYEALDVGLIPIFCLSEKTAAVSPGVKIVAYEPIFAIGSGQPDNPENAEEVAKFLKERLGQELIVLYGGSIDKENVKSFCEKKNLNGVLVGTASLDPLIFFQIVQYAAKV